MPHTNHNLKLLGWQLCFVFLNAKITRIQHADVTLAAPCTVQALVVAFALFKNVAITFVAPLHPESKLSVSLYLIVSHLTSC